MELNIFISNNSNYVELIKEENINVINYKNYYILKYPYNYDNFDCKWKYYCKGAIVDKNTNKLVCIPPVHSSYINDNINDIFEDNDPVYFQDLIDGTMVNLFYDKYTDQWTVSTRSNIGGNNKLNHSKSCKNLFNESGGTLINYDTLNKNCSYSFVLLHKTNRNVSRIIKNSIILVDIFNLDEYNYLDIRDINIYKDPYISLTIHSKCVNLNEYREHINNINFTDTNYNYKGYIIKHKNGRVKCINPYFTNILKLKNNIYDLRGLFSYLYLNNNVYNYLQYYPEHVQLFKKNIRTVDKIKSEIFNYYRLIYITKEYTLKECPFHLKPCLKQIHIDYKNNNKINNNYITGYIKSMDYKQLSFILKHY